MPTATRMRIRMAGMLVKLLVAVANTFMLVPNRCLSPPLLLSQIDSIPLVVASDSGTFGWSFVVKFHSCYHMVRIVFSRSLLNTLGGTPIHKDAVGWHGYFTHTR